MIPPPPATPRPAVDVTAEPGTPERTGVPVRSLEDQLKILRDQNFTDAEIRHYYPRVAALLTPPATPVS